MKNKILYGILSVIIIIGIVMFFVHGFNIGNVYGNYTKIGFYMEQGVNKDELKEIANEVFPNREIMYQDVEYFGEMVLITTNSVSDEEVDNFVAKIKEKYSEEYSKEDLEIVNMPSLKFKEVINPYILPVAISLLVSIVYVALRYYKLGILKMIGKTVLAIVAFVLAILSIYLIFNLPIDVSIVPAVLIGLGVALLFVTSTNSSKLEEMKKAEEENT